MDQVNDGAHFKSALTALEKEMVEALANENWQQVESTDEKLKETMKFWVDNLDGPENFAERDEARVFIEALMARYQSYLQKVMTLQEEASNELKKLQNEKKAINQYLDHKF